RRSGGVRGFKSGVFNLKQSFSIVYGEGHGQADTEMLRDWSRRQSARCFASLNMTSLWGSILRLICAVPNDELTKNGSQRRVRASRGWITAFRLRQRARHEDGSGIATSRTDQEDDILTALESRCHLAEIIFVIDRLLIDLEDHVAAAET